jgi:hypothetical protein
VNRLGLLLAATLAACTCPPTYHQEQTYASNAMADHINLCASGGNCTILCSRAFALEPATIDSCRIVSLDHNGGAFVEVTWTEYVCTFEDWSDGDDGGGGGDWDYEDDDYDPCTGGGCDPGDPEYPEDLPGDEEPPDDEEPPPDDEEPPPDDDWMDEGPP